MSNLKAEEYRSFEEIKKLFRISQTEEKLKKEKVDSSGKATITHYEVGSTVGKAIKDIGGTMPEDFPTPKKVLRKRKKNN